MTEPREPKQLSLDLITHEQREPMTVSDLISALSNFPPDLPLVTNGPEGGYKNIHRLARIQVLMNVNSEWYYGPHDELDAVSNPSDYEKADVLLIR